jgi:transcription elongation GreA/GreB family factor
MEGLQSKLALKDELERLLGADLVSRESAHRAAMAAATHEEAKPENDKDTRALEQSYLARGEALRVEELRQGLAEVRAMVTRAFHAGDPVALGALVIVDENDQALILWLAPYGGGMRLGEGHIQVVTPRSPLGRALLGKKAGDDCEVLLAGRTRWLSIREIH